MDAKQEGIKKYLVTGAAGFIGHHLAKYLKKAGFWVRGVDWMEPEYGCEADEFMIMDLRDPANCMKATEGIDAVYAFAADMGGMGFIGDKDNQALIMHNNTLIDFHTLEAASRRGVKKLLYSSSACVYPEHLQDSADVSPLKESDVYPAQPQDSYGWQKLQTEHMCSYYSGTGMDIKVVRFHNIYGPESTWKGGREKAPAALCRKVATAALNGSDYIEIWGDGEQTRSFCYIDDCLKALHLIMQSSLRIPINLGRDEMVTINELARIIMEVAGKKFKIKYVEGTQGVRGRNSDNSFFEDTFGWKPEIDLTTGLRKMYEWVYAQVGVAETSRP
jgi:nucleoside-diphosphate-sugar epimerase